MHQNDRESMAKMTVNYVFIFILKIQDQRSKSKANFCLQSADFCLNKVSIKKFLLHWNSIDNNLFLFLLKPLKSTYFRLENKKKIS